MHIYLLANQLWLAFLIMGMFQGFVSPKLHLLKQLVLIIKEVPTNGNTPLRQMARGAANHTFMHNHEVPMGGYQNPPFN